MGRLWKVVTYLQVLLQHPAAETEGTQIITPWVTHCTSLHILILITKYTFAKDLFEINFIDSN
jgi:hypothetical protein